MTVSSLNTASTACNIGGRERKLCASGISRIVRKFCLIYAKIELSRNYITEVLNAADNYDHRRGKDRLDGL